MALLVYTWACILISGLMILEAMMHYPSGVNFHISVKNLLGKGWNAINSITIAFVLYTLTYAYISAGGSIIEHTLEGIVSISQTTAGLFGLLFTFLAEFIVY